MKNNIVSVARRAASTLTKEAGDISSVFPSLSGKKPDPLPSRFSDLKKLLIKGNEGAVIASWQRLLTSLKREIKEIRSEGSNVRQLRTSWPVINNHDQIIPSIEYQDVVAGTIPQSKLDSIRHRGTAVIRNVLP